MFLCIKGKAIHVEMIERFGYTGKCMFWQTVINDQRPKLKLQVNGIEIENLGDIGVDVTIISQSSWNSEWPLQKVYTYILGIEKLYEIKQSVRCIKCVQLTYVADIPINFMVKGSSITVIYSD